MVGDAMGDYDAAMANGALFYPIDPGFEDQSWQRFFEEALPRFFNGNLRRRVHGGANRPIRKTLAGTAAVEGVKWSVFGFQFSVFSCQLSVVLWSVICFSCQLSVVRCQWFAAVTVGGP